MFRFSISAAALLSMALLPATSFGFQMAEYMVTLPEPGKVQVTYRLPSPNVDKNSSEKFELGCPIEDGFSNPNLICYDQKYLQLFVDNKMNAPVVCGAGTYFVISKDGKEIEVGSGLDEDYLGRKFREKDLIEYLQRRIAGTAIARQVTATIPENQNRQLKTSKLWFAKVFRYTPWERDTASIISLLSKSQLETAIPILNQLTKDPSETVRYQALMGLGKLSQEHESAAKLLFDGLKDRDAKMSRTALDGLRYGKGKAVPYLIKAMQQSVPGSIDALPTLENSLSVAEEGWLAGLKHRDAEVRKGTMRHLWTYRKNNPDQAVPDAIENNLSIRVGTERETQENRKLARSILQLIYQDVPDQVERE